jgi:hypothetical protein
VLPNATVKCAAKCNSKMCCKIAHFYKEIEALIFDPFR